MAYSVVQKNGATATNVATCSVVLGSTPTQGNLLVLVGTAGWSGGATITGPSGWTAVGTIANWDALSIWCKVAGAGEPATVTATGPATSSFVLQVYEISGLTNAPDQFASAAGASATTSLPTGTTATLASANELCIAAFSYESATNLATAYSNSYVQQDAQSASASYVLTLDVAFRTVTTTAAQSSTATLSTAQTGAQSMIATFPIAGAGLSAPANLHTTSVGSTTIGLAWNAVVGAVGYELVVALAGALTVPGVPTGVTATAGDGQATVSWTAPASNGGSAIIDYTVTSSPGGFTSTGATSPRTVTGLTNGTAYTFTVKARNSVGLSGASAASAAVTPSGVAPGAFYVAPNGNDSNAGTVGSPFATLGRANTAVAAGGTVYLRGGTYSLSAGIILNKSGTQGAPTVFTAYSGETPILDGASSGIADFTAVVRIEGCHDITFSYIQVRNAPNNGVGIAPTNVQRIIIDHVYTQNTQRAGIRLCGADYCIVRNSETYLDNMSNIEGALGASGWGAGTGCGTPTNGNTFNTGNQWLNNYIHQGWGEGINTFRSDGATVSGNHIVDHYAQKLYSDDSKNGTLINNFIEQPDATYHRYSGGENGIAVQSETGFQRPMNMIINGNTFGAGIVSPEVIAFDIDYNVTEITQSPNPQSWP